jgi:hypothetical protein
VIFAGHLCRKADCPERATMAVLTPFGTPFLCMDHGTDVALAFKPDFLDCPDVASPERQATLAWLRDAHRFGPTEGGREA